VQCIVIGPVCLWVCYHDNSKLHASILTKLCLYVKVITISSWLNFGRPVPPEGGLRQGEFFWLRLTTTSAECLRLLWALFSLLSLLRQYWKQRIVFAINLLLRAFEALPKSSQKSCQAADGLNRSAWGSTQTSAQEPTTQMCYTGVGGDSPRPLYTHELLLLATRELPHPSTPYSSRRCPYTIPASRHSLGDACKASQAYRIHALARP